MENDFFKRYGLPNTSVTSYKPVIKRRADGYVADQGIFSNAVDYIALRPSGAFLSTVNDMLKWEMLLQENEILEAEHLHRMWEDVVKTTAKSTNGEVIYYGHGYRVANYLDRKVVFHTGALPGFRAIFYRFPKEKTAIVVLTNSEPENIVAIAEGLADIIFEKK
jgi:CubicO group peptidase (beta-lactamase class C family)